MSQETILSEIISGLKSSYGEAFFNTICLQLDKVVGADYTFIARLNRETWTSRTIALVAHGEIAPNFEYELNHTPCADVTDDSTCVYPKDICTFYPKDQLLIDMKIEGYIGSPLHSSKGDVMGLVVALYEKPIKNPELTQQLFELFSGRISAEVERSERELELQHLTETLEDQVNERTKALTETLEHLKQTQNQMVEQERLASLGSLVAGVAHEINTPLGVALLSGSNITELAFAIDSKVKDQSLSKRDLETNLADILESGESLMHNLQRAANLVSNFKQVAAERNANELSTFNLAKWLSTQLSSLHPLLKKNQITIETHWPEYDIEIYSNGAKLSQVLVNLVSNAVTHAFPDEFECDVKTIRIDVAQSNSSLTMTISDNGIGIPEQDLTKVVEPFYTTKRNQGGTGLGLSIVHNIVVGPLEGEMSIESNTGEGTKVILTLPLKVNS